jgi:hypothetical protein
MSRLQALLVEAKKGLEPWERVPDSSIPLIAAQCGAAERAEIGERIAVLKAELAAIEDWDGDTRDDIHRAIAFFTRLAAALPAA